MLMDKCSKVEALDLNEPKNPQRWDRFESILQNFIFVIQVISLFAIHGNELLKKIIMMKLLFSRLYIEDLS